MKWEDITVQQFQQITELKQGADSRDPAFVLMGLVEVCYNMTRAQVDSLVIEELNELIKGLAFLSDMPEWKPMKHVTLDGRRYRFVYDVRQIHAARNIEVKTFSEGGLVPNLHKMAASMVIPQRRNIFRQWKDEKYDAAKHEQYAADLRQAPIAAIYGSAVFFCEVFLKSIPAIADYLVSTIPTNQRETTRKLLLDSCEILAGSSMQNPLQTSKISLWTGLTNSHTSTS